MTRHHRRVLALGGLAASVVLLVACASGASSNTADGSTIGPASPLPPEGEVLAVGTIMDHAGEVELCLGPIAESYPPQCDGLPVEDWTWEGVDGFETSGDVTWGAYAVRGTYDGATFTTVGPPTMLALYDPMIAPDPTAGQPGAGDDATLERLQEELPDMLGDAYLSSSPENGWLWVDVVWDDGTWQRAVDDAYGAGVVVIRSALRTVG
ncbi:hypothetical protein HF576_16910 [Microbacterium sp. CFH 90308]|uniref:Uncharacterized protein n=1 Tax=Microbacterium salsuginis TaxID=2722803 RepID=A0ABX1KGD6_9MICO|nr:hypothetical protein [Microbacterium sp. CFH 90308]NLP85522.1 hypothetical protein [Microbacterium sp. CFH 90308]